VLRAHPGTGRDQHTPRLVRR